MASSMPRNDPMDQSQDSAKFKIAIGWDCDGVIKVMWPPMDQSEDSAKV